MDNTSIIITVVICSSVILSILSVLVYFAKFHNTRAYEGLKQELDSIGQLAKTNEDDLRKINNKMRFK